MWRIMISATILAFVTVATEAQESPYLAPPPSSATTVPEAPAAPVGHRQPTPNSLPANTRELEQQPGAGEPTPEERELDRRLTICRGC
jgi:hypothetical protein